MAVDLLILNPPSSEFHYVPVGSFALASWLGQQGYEARIVSLANVPPRDAPAYAKAAIERHEPRHVGLLLHWKETLNAFLSIGERIHRAWPQLPIWSGGITAGYYAAEMLERFDFLRGVVRGDPEPAMRTICSGGDLAAAPNLFHRGPEGIRAPRADWFADTGFLNELRYGDLSRIDDRERYLQLIDTRLGLPLAAGRGCAHDCGYCGGSRSAFKLHSARPKLSLRSPARVVDDLQQAFELGARCFLVTHVSAVAEEILDEIARRFPAPLPFTVHLEAWDVPHRSLLARYAGMRPAKGCLPRHVLLSLHGAPTEAERAAEIDATADATAEMFELAPDAGVTIFSGYFAPWQVDARRLKADLATTVALRRRFAGKRFNMAMMALSTDPGSRWSLGEEAIVSEIGLSWLARGATAESAVTDNLLLHRPRALAREEGLSFQGRWHLDRALHEGAPLVWAALVAALDSDAYWDLLGQVSGRCYHAHEDRVYPVVADVVPVALAAVAELVSPPGTPPSGERAVAADLARLELARRLASMDGAARPKAGAEGGLPAFLILNDRGLFTSRHDLDLLVDEHAAHGTVSAEALRTCAGRAGARSYLLLPEISRSQPPGEIDLLRMFDGVTPSERIVRTLAGRLGAPQGAVERRVEELWQSQMLIAV